MKWKFITAGQHPDDVAVVTQIIRGESLRASAPTELNAYRDGSDDWHISAVGHPREREIPESYIARLRRVTGGVFLRDIPLVPGIRQAAILKRVVHGFSGFTWVWAPLTITNNNIVAITDSDSYVYAVQPIVNGTEINARVTLPAPPAGDLTGAVKMSFGPGDYTDLAERIGLAVSNVGYSTSQTRVYVYNWGSSEEAALDIPSVDGVVFIRIVWSGTEIRFYISGSPLAGSDKPKVVLRDVPTPSDPNYLRISVRNPDPYFSLPASAICKVENITIADSPSAQTIYSLGEQQEDNSGSGIAVGNLDIEMWQVSPYVPDQKGFSVRGSF